MSVKPRGGRRARRRWSGKPAAGRLSTKSRSSGSGSKGAGFIVAVLAVLFLIPFSGPASGAGPLAAEQLSADFRRAVKLLADPIPERRAEGEKLIRAMGKRAVP